MTLLRQALVDYLAIRRALGTQLREPAMALQHFLDLLEAEGSQIITMECALRWAQQPKGAQRATWARRLTAVRRFATWLCAFDPRTEVPPPGILNSRHRRNPPHIFSSEEVERLMTEAARLHSPNGLRALTIQTLLGLLASTGLRPGEAISLGRADVDLQDGILAVRNTKFGKSRFVPVDETTRIALATYAKALDQLCHQRQTAAFLVRENGKRLEPSGARRTFAVLSCAIGLRAPRQGRRIARGPRLMDFRHTFATLRLIEWYRAGIDVARALPTLSTYLGHVSIAHTYWYIEAVPELLQLATEASIALQHGGA